MASDEPANPTDLNRGSMWAAVKRARIEFREDNATDLAGSLTYHAVLAVVPGLIVLLSILGLTQVNTHVLTTQVSSLAPGSSGKVVQTLIQQAQAHHSGAGEAAIAGIVIALWSASGYLGAFMRSANRIFDIGEGRPIWTTAPIRLGLTLFATVILVLMALIVVVTGSVAGTVASSIGAGHTVETIFEIAKWPVLLVLITVLLAVLFWAAPNAKQAGIRWISPGGIVATVALLVVSAIFALYVADFSSYNRTYGPLAGIVIFFVWIWLSNVAVLFGLEVNAELERQKAIAGGLPEGTEPFVEPRDTRKMTPEERREVQLTAQARERGA
jgi:membrane protein